METRKLELKDIAGYLPYKPYCITRGGSIFIIEGFKVNRTYDKSRELSPLLQLRTNNVWNESFSHTVENIKIILRPLSDLYKPITHNGKEIVPIVELAKICDKHKDWMLGNKCAVCSISNYHFRYDYGFMLSEIKAAGDVDYVSNQYQLFDYLHELKIDYRGLIKAGLAIDANTLDINPYKRLKYEKK